jgi:hypothetical protein
VKTHQNGRNTTHVEYRVTEIVRVEVEEESSVLTPKQEFDLYQFVCETYGKIFLFWSRRYRSFFWRPQIFWRGIVLVKAGRTMIRSGGVPQNMPFLYSVLVTFIKPNIKSRCQDDSSFLRHLVVIADDQTSFIMRHILKHNYD